MNNKFDNNINENDEDVREIIDVEEVVEVNNFSKKEYENYYRNIVDEIVNERYKRNRRKNKVIVSVVACALVFAFSGGFLTNNYLNGKNSNKTQNTEYKVNSNDNSTINKDGNRSLDDESNGNAAIDSSEKKENLSTEEIAKLVSPSVVTVTATSGGNMFGQSSQGVGTGFVVEKDGKIITNYHVIEDSNDIKVTLYNGKEAKAKIVRTSKKDDLAVLQIVDDIEIPDVATLATDDNVNAGQEIVAIGNPLGAELSGSVTKGIVSSPKRMVNMDGFEKEFIQIDAAINPGNSGGPLINSKGEIIGVNTAKRSGENVEGIGFAVPIKYVIELLENPNNYRNENEQSQNGIYQGEQYGWGESPEQYQEGYSEQYPGYSGNNGVTLGVKVLEGDSGIIVAGIENGGLAEASGVQVGDVIVGVNGVRISSVSDLKEKLTSLNNGKSTKLNIKRNGKSIRVVLAS